MAVQFALMKSGDKMMGMSLNSGRAFEPSELNQLLVENTLKFNNMKLIQKLI